MYDINQVLTDTEKKMKSAIEAMVQDFATFRTGRANPVILKRVLVDCYGSEMPISQVANITVPEPRQLLITPYDKSMLGNIERAITSSDLGVTPNNDGNNIRINFPAMTEERRKELVKQVNARTEQGCVAVRAARQDAIDKIKAAQKNNEATEDDVVVDKERVQKLTDKYVAEAHSLQKKKDAELMEV